MESTQQIMGKLGTIFLSWKRMLQRKVLPCNCTLKHHYLLKRLKTKGSMRPSDIADHLFCDRPTASVVIRNMEKNGWISKRKDPENKKSFLITISSTGEQKLKETTKALQLDFDPLATLSDEERGQLLSILRKIKV